jgi:hypothetical protein
MHSILPTWSLPYALYDIWSIRQDTLHGHDYRYVVRILCTNWQLLKNTYLVRTTIPILTDKSCFKQEQVVLSRNFFIPKHGYQRISWQRIAALVVHALCPTAFDFHAHFPAPAQVPKHNSRP